jgi:iron complex transport system ATP-binding protein
MKMNVGVKIKTIMCKQVSTDMPSATNNKIAEFKNIYVSYGEGDVLHGVDLDVGELEHTAILGANGSGKSTLIKLFSNDIYPRILQGSSKKMFGKERWSIFELKRKLGIVTNNFHYLLQHTAPDISCFEAVVSSFYSSIGIFDSQEYDDSMRVAAQKAIEKVGISHLTQKPICGMSTGELRKCIIARALALEPKTLLLDEPTVGLDIRAQIEFIDTIRALSKEKTIILITHHIEEIFPEIQKVVLLKNGKIFKSGTKEEVMTSQNLSDTFDVNIELGVDNERYFVKKLSAC